MNLHEYQSKEILAKYGVNIQRGFVANNVDEAVDAAKKLKQIYPNSYPLGNEKGVIGWYGFSKPFMLVNHTSEDIMWDGSKFIFGATTDNMKDTITYLNKLYKENQNFLCQIHNVRIGTTSHRLTKRFKNMYVFIDHSKNPTQKMLRTQL